MIRRRTIPFLLGLATIAAAGSLATSSPASADTGNFILGLGGCLQPVGGSVDAGAAVVQEPCDWSGGTPAQHWTFDVPDGQVVHYRNVNSGLCLDAFGSATNGTPVIQWPCNSISNERWLHVPFDASQDAVPSEPIISRVSGTSSHCLDVPNADPTPGHQVQIWRCNGTDAQLWNTFF